MTTTPTKLITAEQFLRMPDDNKVYELVKGRLVEVGGASWLSSTVAMTIGIILGAYVRERKLGKVSGADMGATLVRGPDTVRVPDIAFIRAERFPDGKGPRGFFEGAPDLAVEVLSPTDRYTKTMKKVREYLAAGARLVWVIDPVDRTATVHRADGSITDYEADGVLDGEAVIPGFTLRLADIWEEVEDPV